MAPRAGVTGGQPSWVLGGEVLCGRKSSGLSSGKALNRGAGAICPWCLQHSSYNLGIFPQSPLAGPPLTSRTPCSIGMAWAASWGTHGFPCQLLTTNSVTFGWSLTLCVSISSSARHNNNTTFLEG